MKVSLVGFAGCGKTTIFNVLTGLRAEVGGFAKGKMNLGNIKVPDERIEKLSAVYNPKKKVYGEIVFSDLVGVRAEEEGVKGKGMGPAEVAEMRNSETLAVVLRGFENLAVSESIDPLKELQGFEQELVFADLMQVENRLARIAKERSKKHEDKELFVRMREYLETEKPLRDFGLTEGERGSLSGFAFLTLKPILFLLNVDEGRMGKGSPFPEVSQFLEERGEGLITIAGQAEMEIAELDEEERTMFLEELGIQEPARGGFIKAAYAKLNLISFLTVGPDEVRAWPIMAGSSALQSAGKIHSDIQRGFIRAEVMAYEEFMELGSEQKMKEAGKARLEGKEYVVKDGDIINFRFNV